MAKMQWLSKYFCAYISVQAFQRNAEGIVEFVQQVVSFCIRRFVETRIVAEVTGNLSILRMLASFLQKFCYAFEFDGHYKNLPGGVFLVK